MSLTPETLKSASSLGEVKSATTVGVWPSVLSGSIVVAAITTILYLVGAARHESSSHVLGLQYLFLEGVPSTQIIYDGGVISLLWIGLLMSLAVIGIDRFRDVKLVLGKIITKISHFKSLPITSKRPLLLAPFLITSCLIISLVRLDQTTIPLNRLACPFAPPGPPPVPSWIFLVVTSSTIAVALPLLGGKFLKIALLAWGSVAGLLCFYHLGFEAGLTPFTSHFDVAHIDAPLVADQEVLIIGADDKNLVYLSLQDYVHTSHSEPTYISRTDIKQLKILRSSTIGNYLCKAAPQNGKTP